MHIAGHGLVVTTGDGMAMLNTGGFKVEGNKNVTGPEMRQPKRPSQSQRKIKPRSLFARARLEIGPWGT